MTYSMISLGAITDSTHLGRTGLTTAATGHNSIMSRSPYPFRVLPDELLRPKPLPGWRRRTHSSHGTVLRTRGKKITVHRLLLHISKRRVGRLGRVLRIPERICENVSLLRKTTRVRSPLHLQYGLDGKLQVPAPDLPPDSMVGLLL